ncbi:MAG: ATP-binding cassette domain-containing protein, partial [Oscillospiraceae bacterium]|nr:ATP-binding cassette domain-containing protein [Oscillospiraceae bacterium]
VDPEFFDELVDAIEIKDKLNRYPDQLSGGEQQRVAIARALVSKPAIILADEPTGNLDPKTGDQVLKHLKELAARFKQTILLVTHDMEIAGMADRIIRLHNGEVIETKDNR